MINPKSLDNLKPFRRGTSGNPQGRPAAGLSLREHYNQMAEWNEADIRLAQADEKAPMAKRCAAERWLRALKEEQALSAIEDRSVGKPVQPVQMAGKLAVPVFVAEGVEPAMLERLNLPDVNNN
jgi:hypothetical protein